MPLITCQECSANISSFATACPHCGLPKDCFVNKPESLKIKISSKAKMSYSENSNDIILYFLGGEIPLVMLSENYKKYSAQISEVKFENNKEEKFLSLSRSGNFIATGLLGVSYLNGEFTDVNYDKAFKLLFDSASHDEPMACCNLGKAYYLGFGVKKDFEQAFKWMEIAAKLGYPEAIAKLGFFYQSGEVIKKNIRKAIQCYDVVLKFDFDNDYTSEVLCNYGLLLCTEDDFFDLDKSVEFLNKSAELDNFKAMNALGCLYIEKLNKYSLGFEYLEKAAEGGNVDAMLNISEFYSKKQYGKFDRVLSYIWLSIAQKSNGNDYSEQMDAISSNMTKDEIIKLEYITKKLQENQA